MFAHLKKNPKPSSGGRWKDNDDDNDAYNTQAKPNSFVNEANQAYRPAFLVPKQSSHSRTQVKRNEGSISNQSQNQIEDFLQSTGIVIKPSDKLLDYFKTRNQNEREKITNELKVKVTNYKSYMTHQDNVKLLSRCLSLIEYFSLNQVQDIKEAFEDRSDLFESIIECYPTNKRINEICNSIISLYSNNNDYHQAQDHPSDDQITSNDNNINLLNLDQGNNDNNLLLIDDLPQQQSRTDNNVNLLEGIFSDHQKPSSVLMEMNKGFPLTQTNPNADLTEVFDIGQVPTQKKQFHFIKSKTPTIGTKGTGMESELNDLFSSSFASSSFQPNAGTPYQNKELKCNPPQEENIAKIEGPQFNYDHVYNNTGLKKENKEEKDPFNFVNNILKSKK